MPIFKVPVLYESKEAIFSGAGAFCMPPLLLEDDEPSGLNRPIRSVKKGQLVEEVPLIVPPVLPPQLEPPLMPVFEEDVAELRQSMLELERTLLGFRKTSEQSSATEMRFEWDRSCQEVHDTKARQELKTRFANNFWKDLASLRNRLGSINAARIEEQEAKRKLLFEQQKAKAKPIPPPVSVPAKPLKETTPDYSAEIYEIPATSERARIILQETQNLLKSVDSIGNSLNDEIKKKRMEYKLSINKRVGQVSNSKNQVMLVIKDFIYMSNSVWKEQGSEMLNYVCFTMATKFIDQAEKQISLHPPSAFPYGQVVVDLIGLIPAFRTILMGLLIQKCPFIIPRYPPRQSGQSETDWKRDLGYKVTEGQVEGESTYIERMSGLIMFYAAIIQSSPIRPNLVNPYDIPFGWVWISSVLNMKPRPITPYILASFLEVAGYRMSKANKEKFGSLLHYLQSTFIPSIPDESISAKTRLSIFVEQALKQCSVEEPEGLRIEGIDYCKLKNYAAA